MNVTLDKTHFTPDEIDGLRARMAEYRATRKLSWTELARDTGIPAGTLSGWVPGTYNGGKIHETHAIAADVWKFFQTLEEREALELEMPGEPSFQMTPTARRILTCLALAHLGDMALVAMPPGGGKSAACKQYAATRSSVWITKAKPSIRGVNTILIAILASMGERGAKGTPQMLSERVCQRVMNSNALIIVDDAQHLSPQALEELRSIHDETEVGIALVGEEALAVTLKKYPQLHSRIGVRFLQARPTRDDIDTLSKAWGVNAGPEMAYLRDIGKQSGALRKLTKTLKLASRAARAGGEPMSLADMRDAVAQRGIGDEA